MDVARLIGQKIEIDGKFKSELTDAAIVLGKRIREIKDGITKTQEKQAESIASLSKKFQEIPRNTISYRGQEILPL